MMKSGHLAEPFFVGERLVDAFSRRLEGDLLMNTLASVRDSIVVRLRLRQAECLLRHSDDGQARRHP
jgi:hypothetical protein